MTIGNSSCKFNARSSHLRCAVNPAGSCDTCEHFAPVDLLRITALTGESIALAFYAIKQEFHYSIPPDIENCGLEITASCIPGVGSSDTEIMAFFQSHFAFSINGLEDKYYRTHSISINRSHLLLWVSELGDQQSIKSEFDYNHWVVVVDFLLNKPSRSPQETALLDRLTQKICEYDDRHHAIPDCDGWAILQELMVCNGLQSADLASVLGGESIAQDIIDNHRAISASQAQALGDRFGLPASLFLDRETASHPA